MQQQQVKTENRIYFEEIPLKPTIKKQKSELHTQQWIEDNKLNEEEQNKINELQNQFNTFHSLLKTISSSTSSSTPTIDLLCKSISDYTLYLVKYQDQQSFFQHAVQNKFIALLLQKVQHYRFLSDIVRVVFSSLQFLVRGMKREDQFVYFLVSINKEGFLTMKYQFEEDDSPYFANFLKLLTRKINQDEKYLNIFYNQKQPHFPLLLNLLRLHDEKDMILKTSVKLTLIELTSNPSKLIQSFSNNFPFIMFYPIYVYQIYHSFIDALSEDQITKDIGRQNLKTTLRFMQDFIISKDKQAIEMYANCFMSLVGKVIYKELSQLSHKNNNKIINILKLLHEIVFKDITIVKIKLGIAQLFNKLIGKNLLKFLKSKTHHIEFTYWLIDECDSDIIEHCSSIYTRVISQGKKSSSSVRSSFLKTFNSYIPRTKDNWLYHQVKKISELIGFEIELKKQIRQNEYMEGSYLKSIEIDSKIPMQVHNELYQKFLKTDCEQILFYYFKLITQLNVPLVTQHITNLQQHHQSITQILSLLQSTTSLSVIKSFYSYIVQNDISINQLHYPKIKHIFTHVLERLVYFILTEGWTTFFNRSKISINKKQNDLFSPDIFRDLQCDILFFVTLRYILGTKNTECIKDNREFGNRDIRRTQTKANCFFVRQCQDNTLIQQPIEIILDGQYIKLIDQETKSISNEDILVNRSFIYESQQTTSLEIVQMEKNQSPAQKYYCITFLEDPIKNYIWKEIKYRKEIVMELQLKLRLMMFQFYE